MDTIDTPNICIYTEHHLTGTYDKERDGELYHGVCDRCEAKIMDMRDAYEQNVVTDD